MGESKRNKILNPSCNIKSSGEAVIFLCSEAFKFSEFSEVPEFSEIFEVSECFKFLASESFVNESSVNKLLLNECSANGFSATEFAANGNSFKRLNNFMLADTTVFNWIRSKSK